LRQYRKAPRKTAKAQGNRAGEQEKLHKRPSRPAKRRDKSLKDRGKPRKVRDKPGETKNLLQHLIKLKKEK